MNANLKVRNGTRILLIDEVDVFFSKELFGNTYRALSNIKDETITQLIEYIWATRKDNMNLK